MYFNDSKGRKHQKQRRSVNGSIHCFVEQVLVNGAVWAFHYMKNELHYREGTCRSAMQGFDEKDRELVEDAIWNGENMSITTPFARSSNYITEGVSAMAERGIDVWQMDLSGLIDDKEQIDAQAQDDEREARDKLVDQHRLYEEGVPKVGASGALARTGCSEVSSVATSTKSTADQNMRLNYQTNKVSLAKNKGKNARLKAFMIA